MGILNLFGLGNKTEKIKQFAANRAVIIDVRSEGEFAAGHIASSRNIPLPDLASRIAEIKKLNTPVITCCRSGMRSGNAASILLKNGIQAINGGGWENLQKKL